MVWKTLGLLGWLIPGMPQMCQKRYGAGFTFLVVACVGYLAFIVPGVIVHGYSIYDARVEEKRHGAN